MSSKGQERRASKRREVLDTFSVFVVIPKKGVHRLAAHDVSETGIGFDLDIEGESAADFPLNKGETLELHLYLNQSLFLPLQVEIVRIEGRGSIRRAGAEFRDQKSKGFKAYHAFLSLLDQVAEAGEIASAG